MRNIVIKKTTNPRLIYRLAEGFDADMHAIETIFLAWTLKIDKEYQGIIGVNRWEKNFSVIDLFVARNSNNKVMEQLLKFLITEAIKYKIESIYCHMGEEKLKFFLKSNFIFIKETALPKNYNCSCHLCDDFMKSCHPKPIKWENKYG